MIPERFCTEIPTRRMIRLLDAMLPIAQQQDLTTSMALMVAMPLLMIALERTTTRGGEPVNAINDVHDARSFVSALRQLKRQPFYKAFLQRPEQLIQWRFLEITRKIDHPSEWRDSVNRHPLQPGAQNDIKEQDVENVLLILRHALAHGNVVYLNEDGIETPGRRVTHLAFVSEGRSRSDACRVLIVEESAFIDFLRGWAQWVSQFNINSSLRRAA
jgi:hypothetical protein